MPMMTYIKFSIFRLEYMYPHYINDRVTVMIITTSVNEIWAFFSDVY